MTVVGVAASRWPRTELTVRTRRTVFGHGRLLDRVACLTGRLQCEHTGLTSRGARDLAGPCRAGICLRTPTRPTRTAARSSLRPVVPVVTSVSRLARGVGRGVANVVYSVPCDEDDRTFDGGRGLAGWSRRAGLVPYVRPPALDLARIRLLTATSPRSNTSRKHALRALRASAASASPGVNSPHRTRIRDADANNADGNDALYGRSAVPGRAPAFAEDGLRPSTLGGRAHVPAWSA